MKARNLASLLAGASLLAIIAGCATTPPETPYVLCEDSGAERSIPCGDVVSIEVE